MCGNNATSPVLIILLLISFAAPAAGQKYFPAAQNSIDEHFTVALDPGVADAQAAAELLAAKYNAQVTYLYQAVLHGFDAAMSEASAISMSENPLVRSIHQDSWIPLEEAHSGPVDNCYDVAGPTNTNQRPLPAIPPCGTSMSCVQSLSCSQPGPDPGDDCIDNWGLDRIDQLVGIDQEVNYRGAATNVSVYVLDYGIRGTNREFLRDGTPPVSRVTPGEDVSWGPNCQPQGGPCPPTANEDCLRGHGTHVAGIIAGRTFGLAKDATLVPIRVGSWVDSPPCFLGVAFSAFKRGFDRIGVLHSPSSPTAVVNISGGNANSEWFNVNNPNTALIREAMINLASRDNILVVQSAGNQGADACDYSFGDEDDYSGADAAAIARIVVAAGFDPDLGQFVDTDLPNNASNWGPCVDIWAPAADIVSSGGWLNDPVNNRVCRLTGTSMAAPQVSGVAAVLLGEAPFTTTDQLRATLLEWATYNTLGYATGHPIEPGSPNVRVRRAEGILFEDGFNFDRSRWNGEVTTNGAALSVCPEAAMPSTTYKPDGAPNGLCVGLPGVANAQAFVRDHRPVAETRYYASFFAHFGDLSMQPNDSYVIFDAVDAAGPVFRVRHRGDGFVRIHGFDDVGGTHVTPWIDYGTHAGSRALEISWQAGSPGLVTIAVSGLALESVSFQNSSRKVEQVRLGAVAGVPANASGVLKVDTFGSWTNGFRGMGGVCHPAVDIFCAECCHPWVPDPPVE